MTALGALLVLFLGLIALRQHRRAIRLEAAHDRASEAADDWSRIAQAEFQESDRLRAALRLENARYDAALKVLDSWDHDSDVCECNRIGCVQCTGCDAPREREGQS